MIKAANDRHFHPECVIFDSWYASIENLKLIRSMEWHWFTRLKSNRLVNPDDTSNRPVSEVEIPPEGRVVHLRQYGFIKIFKVVHDDSDVEYWATDILDASESDRRTFKDCGWNIEKYHRELNSAAELRGVRVGKMRSSAAIFSLRYSHFSDWNPID